MKTEPTSQAFPVAATTEDVGHFGMTKREYFAALALQGLLSNPEDCDAEENPEDLAPSYARSSVIYADALIAALNE